MKYTLSTYEAAERLFNDENANWSRAGAFALCEHLEDLENELGEEFDFCQVSLRCDFSQYSSLEEWASDQFANHVQAVFELKLNIDGDGKIEESPEEIDTSIREYIRDRGTLLEFSDGVIVSSF